MGAMTHAMSAMSAMSKKILKHSLCADEGKKTDGIIR